MYQIPFVLYYLSLYYGISPQTILQLHRSTKWVQLDFRTHSSGPIIPFAGLEPEYLELVIDTASIRQATFSFNLSGNVIAFLQRFVPDPVPWFKALFRLCR
jgi:hypothetical protein